MRETIDVIENGELIECQLVWSYSVLFFVAAVSVECLAAVTCELEDIHPLGQMLGVSEDYLSAIDTYYDDKESKFQHTLMVWQMANPEEPELLISVLNEMMFRHV